MRQLRARILRNEEVAKGFCKMRIESPELARKIQPGQFVLVRCSGGAEPLLRRPLGCHRILQNGIEMLYEIVGKGTEILSRKRAGESLDIIGPLGNGFAIDHRPQTTDRRPVVLVAGGIGVAPLVALAEELDRGRDLHVLIGACKKSHVLCEDEFKKIGAQVSIATEDGSKGYKGFATNLLELELFNRRTGEPASRRTIYACGPTAMLKAVAAIAKARRIPCQVLLEERMACGVGVCLGCPVRVHESKPANRRTGEPANHIYKMICKDGPVFDAEEIVW